MEKLRDKRRESSSKEQKMPEMQKDACSHEQQDILRRMRLHRNQKSLKIISK